MSLNAPSNPGLGIAIVRVIVGLGFVISGCHDWAGSWTDARLGWVLMGFPDWQYLTPVTAGLQVVAGSAMVVGVFSRLAALLLAAYVGVLMFVVATRGVIWADITHVWFLPTSLFQVNLVAMSLSSCVAVAGPGTFALDSAIRKKGRASGRRLAWGVALARAVAGLAFLVHGYQKVFVVGLPDVAAGFARLGFPAPWLLGVLAAVVELLCGLLLVGGLFTRWAAAVLAVEMAVALLTVHLREGFLVGAYWPGGYGYVLVLLSLSAALAVGGAGTLALENTLILRWHRREGRREETAG